MAPIIKKLTRFQQKSQAHQPSTKVLEESLLRAHADIKNSTSEQSSPRNTKNGVEIIDFHDSWRKELEYYKNRLQRNKKKGDQSETIQPESPSIILQCNRTTKSNLITIKSPAHKVPVTNNNDKYKSVDNFHLDGTSKDSTGTNLKPNGTSAYLRNELTTEKRQIPQSNANIPSIRPFEFNNPNVSPTTRSSASPNNVKSNSPHKTAGQSSVKSVKTEEKSNSSPLERIVKKEFILNIDDGNERMEENLDKKYVGDPLYLAADGFETHQSRDIHYNVNTSNTKAMKEKSYEGDQSSRYYKPRCILSPSLFPNVPPYLNFTCHCSKGPYMPPELHRVLKWKLSPSMPRIVKRVVLNSGFRIIKNTVDWMAIWERQIKSSSFSTIRSHQKYNHLPGSVRIGRKDCIWRCIKSSVEKFGAKEFGFMQESYIMPQDVDDLRQVWRKNSTKLRKWIVKPPACGCGNGIRIVNKWNQFPKDRPLVVQKYIEHPLLINDNKFDMRIYVFIPSVNPLRIYMHKDGLARFASVKYSSEHHSINNRYVHLTNYSINKYSKNYSKNQDFFACQGHKWTLQSLWSCLEERGVNTKRLWATLRDMIIKSIISGESGMSRLYRQNVNFRNNCFELLGFDVLLDENLIPWLLEINTSPSLHSELPLDLHIKGPLVQAVLNTALFQVPPKLKEQQREQILNELNLEGPLCYDRRIFATGLTEEEVNKHNYFLNRSIEHREEYVDEIFDKLLPDDIRCLVIAEDELYRSQPLERIFPSSDTHVYLKYMENPRYYNRLLDAWEYRFGKRREEGIAVLRRFCDDGYHLQVSDEALKKEPNVALTDIDLLYQKKKDRDANVCDIVPSSKDITLKSNIDLLKALLNKKNKVK